MGDGMPYHLEKGPLLRILESHLNGNRSAMQGLLQIVEDSVVNDSLDWILTGAPELWADPAFTHGPQSGEKMRERLITEWFGYVKDGAGGWVKPNPAPSTTGYWIGYRGDVHEIVRAAVRWALEVSLAAGSTASSGRRAPAPWPIELFWKCPAPWFEAWVVSRRVAGIKRGLVTLVLVTPSHKGATVSDTPIAHSPQATPPGATHPVPSWQDDYEQLQTPHPDPVNFPGRPRVVPAMSRNNATWVVTHEQHAVVGGGLRPFEQNTAAPVEFANWRIPQLAVYEGTGPIVVVAPSMAAGGVKHDGSV